LVEGINLVIGWHYYFYQIFLNNIACKVDDTNLFFWNKILIFFHEKRVFFSKEYNFFVLSLVVWRRRGNGFFLQHPTTLYNTLDFYQTIHYYSFLNGLIYFQDSIKTYPTILKIQGDIDIKEKAKCVEFSLFLDFKIHSIGKFKYNFFFLVQIALKKMFMTCISMKIKLLLVC